MTTRTKITPPMLAHRWGCKVQKIHQWIKSGELRAIDGAGCPGGRPRYMLDESDIADFEERRAVTPTPRPAPRRRKNHLNVIEFF